MEREYICIEAMRGRCVKASCRHGRNHVKVFSYEELGKKTWCYENGYHKVYNKEEKSRYKKNARTRKCAGKWNPHCIEVGSLEHVMLKIIMESENAR
jgi:hypothetical protein